MMNTLVLIRKNSQEQKTIGTTPHILNRIPLIRIRNRQVRNEVLDVLFREHLVTIQSPEELNGFTRQSPHLVSHIKYLEIQLGQYGLSEFKGYKKSLDALRRCLLYGNLKTFVLRLTWPSDEYLKRYFCDIKRLPGEWGRQVDRKQDLQYLLITLTCADFRRCFRKKEWNGVKRELYLSSEDLGLDPHKEQTILEGKLLPPLHKAFGGQIWSGSRLYQLCEGAQ